VLSHFHVPVHKKQTFVLSVKTKKRFKKNKANKMQWGAYSFYDWTDASKNTDKLEMIATKETYFIDS